MDSFESMIEVTRVIEASEVAADIPAGKQTKSRETPGETQGQTGRSPVSANELFSSELNNKKKPRSPERGLSSN